MTLRPLLSILLAAPALLAAQTPDQPSAMPAGMADEIKARIAAADTDHDGRISRAEFMAARQAQMPNGRGDPARMFARMDADGDGYLSQAEIDATVARRMARFGAGGGQGGMRPAPVEPKPDEPAN